MALLENHFYHGSIKTYTAVVGTLFNDLSIVRSDGKQIKVPLQYAGQQKQNVRLDARPDEDDIKYKMRLPRLSYQLVDWERDVERAQNRQYRVVDNTVDRQTSDDLPAQFTRVPYRFIYEVNLKTKHIDDLFQVVEQVLVAFNPSLEVVVNDNPDLNESSSIVINLTGSSFNDEFAGAFEDPRVLEATFNIEVEGYLYMPTDNASIIKQINLNYYELSFPDTLIDTDVIDETDL